MTAQRKRVLAVVGDLSSLGAVLADITSGEDTAPAVDVSKPSIAKEPPPPASIKLVVNNDKPAEVAPSTEGGVKGFGDSVRLLYWSREPVGKGERVKALQAILRLVRNKAVPAPYRFIAGRIFNDAYEAGDVSLDLDNQAIAVFGRAT